MTTSRRRVSLSLGLITVGLTFAPAPPQDQPPRLASLGDARYKAAIKQFDETWTYYQQARIDSYQVYVWSRILLDCRLDMLRQPSERVAAFQEHLARMKKLEALVKKVRRLGFGRSYDVGASEYYRLEGEYWLARQTAQK